MIEGGKSLNSRVFWSATPSSQCLLRAICVRVVISAICLGLRCESRLSVIRIVKHRSTHPTQEPRVVDFRELCVEDFILLYLLTRHEACDATTFSGIPDRLPMGGRIMEP